MKEYTKEDFENWKLSKVEELAKIEQILMSVQFGFFNTGDSCQRYTNKFEMYLNNLKNNCFR